MLHKTQTAYKMSYTPMQDVNPRERLHFSQEPLSASSRPSRSPQPDPPSSTPTSRDYNIKRTPISSSTEAVFRRSPVSSVPRSSTVPTSPMEENEVRDAVSEFETQFLELLKKRQSI